jgi:hypothetical protein
VQPRFVQHHRPPVRPHALHLRVQPRFVQHHRPPVPPLLVRHHNIVQCPPPIGPSCALQPDRKTLRVVSFLLQNPLRGQSRAQRRLKRFLSVKLLRVHLPKLVRQVRHPGKLSVQPLQSQLSEVPSESQVLSSRRVKSCVLWLRPFSRTAIFHSLGSLKQQRPSTI